MDASASKTRKLSREEFVERMLADQELRKALALQRRKAEMKEILAYASCRKAQTIRRMQMKQKGL